MSGQGRSPGGGHGNPLQYSCLENPMDRGAWQAAVHRITESNTTEVTQHTPFSVPQCVVCTMIVSASSSSVVWVVWELSSVSCEQLSSCVYLLPQGQFQFLVSVLLGLKLTFGLKDLQCDWGCCKAYESFFILLICLKDEAVTEAPKEVMTSLFHCEALFRKNGRKVQTLQKCNFQRRTSPDFLYFVQRFCFNCMVASPPQSN